MNSDNQQVIYCEDDDYRVYYNIFHKLCFELFYKNHMKSGTHINIIHERQQLNKSFQIISLN